MSISSAIEEFAGTFGTETIERFALPLLAYFFLMWGGSFLAGRAIGLPYDRTTTLAIAVAVGVFGLTSGQALAGAVGPLIEVPVLVALVYVSLRGRKLFKEAVHA